MSDTDQESREAIPPHETEVVDTEWDSNRMVARIPNEEGEEVLRDMFAWVDPSLDADDKQSYSFPHHQVDTSGIVGAANANGCIAGIAALNGARLQGSPLDQPWGDDREEIHEHLANHLEDADIDPPELLPEGELSDIEGIDDLIDLDSVYSMLVEEKDDVSDEEQREESDKEEENKESDEQAEERDTVKEKIVVHTYSAEDTDMDIEEYFRTRAEENNGVEKRVFSCTEMRQDGEDRVIEGTASVFNQKQEIGPFEEVVRPGAFQKTIREGDTRALFNHDPNFVLGRQSAGTLELEENANGLFFKNDVPNTSYGNDLLVSVRRRDITGASIGFKIVRQKFSEQDGSPELREILEVKLRDVGPVSFPAFPQTSISSRDEWSEFRAMWKADNKSKFDFRQLVDAIVRSERGEVFDESDNEIIDEAIQYLKSMKKCDRSNDVMGEVREELRREVEKDKDFLAIHAN